MLILNYQSSLLFIQHGISFCGVMVILFGVLRALYHYINYSFNRKINNVPININDIRLNLGRVLTLGLEFIVAADLIGTTTTPDYYSVGIVASIVLIRTFLSYTLNKEINSISQNEISHIK